MKNEPLVTTATITAGTTAVLALLVAFGVPLSEAQQIAILGVAAVAAPLAVAVVARRLVTPNGSVVESVDPGGTVVAGEANELPTGTEIRELGDSMETEPDAMIVDNPYDTPEG